MLFGVYHFVYVREIDRKVVPGGGGKVAAVEGGIVAEIVGVEVVDEDGRGFPVNGV